MAAKREEETTYQYKHLELALAGVFKVDMRNLPAFKARIRHLRNLGLPTLSQPGSGQKIRYTRADALELLFALEGEHLGLPPQQAVGFSRTMMSTERHKIEAAAASGKRHVWSTKPTFSFDPNEVAIFTHRRGEDIPLLDPDTHRATVINVATSVMLLNSALKRATGEIAPYGISMLNKSK